jgi:hypothetical protein
MRCLGSLRKPRSSLDTTGVACLKPSVFGFMMKFPFAATPVKGARNRKRRLTICYPISTPDTLRLPTCTLVVSTGSRQSSGGVERYCCADGSRFMRCLGSLRKPRSSLDRTGAACLKPGVLGSLLGIAFAATPVKGTSTRKQRLTICYPNSIPDTPRLPIRTPVVSTGSRRLSGGVEKPQGW